MPIEQDGSAGDGGARVAAVIFDMDGVIVDTEAYYCGELAAFSDDFGIGLTADEIAGQVGSSHQTFRRLVVDWLARAGRPVASEDEGQEVYEGWKRGRPCDYAALLNPGVPETIAELHRRGVRTALASSSPMESIRTVLAACGLSDAFEVTVSGEQFRESKPEPDIYLHTLELLGLPASACLCVEDSALGIRAGKRAGLTVLAKREERFGFSQAEADAVIDRIPDLLAYV